jgi:hypothetical protein
MDALDQDPELDAQEKMRARLAVQGMYNAGGSEGAEEGLQYDPLLRGATTTGQGDKEASYELRPRPERRGEQ